MPARTTRSHLTEAILETVDDMLRSGILSESAHQKITMRHLGEARLTEVPPIEGDEIRQIREKARLSQAVFARHLKLTVGYISQLERGVKTPTGPALVLLDIIRRKGIEAIL